MNKYINIIFLFIGRNLCSLRRMKENKTVKEVRGLGDVPGIRFETRHKIQI